MATRESQLWLTRSVRGIRVALAMAVITVTIGVVGFMGIEGWGFIDSFYMTIITVSTVGFGEIHPLSSVGRLFTSILIMAGVGTIAFSFTHVIRVIVEGEFKRVKGYKRMKKEIRNLQDHTIICGFGSFARLIVPDIIAAGKKAVVIENNSDVIAEMESCGAIYVEGNAYEDETLKAAGIERAKNLLALLPRDADNVYITLSARGLNKDIRIVARSSNPSGENKLKRAGADEVVLPYKVSAQMISQQLLRPFVSHFLEVAAGRASKQLALEEVLVPTDSPLAGKTLQDAQLRNKTGAIIAAFIDIGGEMHFNPGSDSVIQPGSTMIVLGELESFSKLYELLGNV